MVIRTRLMVALAATVAGCSSNSAGGAADAPGSDATPGNPGDAGNIPDPAGFWDPSGIPAAKNVMIFKFLNRTNGKFADSEVYWSFKTGSINETHSIADQPTYDMPANSSGRMYFYLCAAGDSTCAADPTKSKYADFIEHTIGPDRYNGNTTRVDAFGLKIAMRLHAADGFEATVGENAATFAEDRDATFQAFIAGAPDEFKPLAQPPFAPYRIVQPGAGGFDTGGAQQHYYEPFVDALWAANGITIAKPSGNAAGLPQNRTDLSAAIYRHVGAVAGTFGTDGLILDRTIWNDPTTFYKEAPADYYAQFWHSRGIDGKAYGFPYDDVGGYSTYISHQNPQYMMVAIGW